MSRDDNSKFRHPPLQVGWIDAPHHRVELGAFALESGEMIADFSVSFAVHGDLNNRKLPIAIVLCAIGSTHHRLDFLIGTGKPLDPRRMRIFAIDAIGNGLSTSPSTSHTQPGFSFPRFSIRDMVNSQKLLLDNLGIAEVDLVIGASMGGMQALQWAVSYPDSMKRIVALTPMAKTSPWAAAINHVARHSLLSRLADDGTHASISADVWEGWTAIMQLIAMRTPYQVDKEFGTAQDMLGWLEKRARWWSDQGFDPVDWVYQSWAYDAHDVGMTPGFDGDTSHGLQSIRVPTLIVTPPLDLYNPIESAEWAATRIPECDLHQVDSVWGHLMASAADTEAAPRLAQIITGFLERTSRR
ncbi:MAG: alpha/beta fold hydrolase [Burkholderiales bacterium]